MLDLLEALGVDPDDFDWPELAACNNLDINWFYDRYEQDDVHARNIIQACLTCPVIKSCFAAGEKQKEEGLWGGVYRNSSGRIDTQRNKFKTEKEWELLESRLGRKVRNAK